MQIQLKYLAEEMQAISKGLEKVVQELTTSENDGPVSETFCRVIPIHQLVILHVNEVYAHSCVFWIFCW